MKCYFGILNNLYVGQKVVLWFGEGQKYKFLSCPLPPVCPVPETVLQIKHWTTVVVLSCPSFLANQTHMCISIFIQKKLLDLLVNKSRILQE